jgi:hypothetical protein
MKRFLLFKNARKYSEAREALRMALKKLPGNAILWQVGHPGCLMPSSSDE